MEFKHFSHNHGLIPHQLPQASQIHCSGCKSPASGNVYVCWQSSYFLHQQCFHASRSLKQPSHPLHPLTLVPFPTYPSGSFFCNSCNLGGDGFCYTCSECEFDIHIHCALTPNPNPHVSTSPFPAPNFSMPNAYPPNTTPPNETQNYTTAAQPPNQHNHPQPNAMPQNHVPPMNATTTPPPPQPSVPAKTNNPQPKIPTMIKHFSHPHLLKPTETEQNNAKLCSACELELSGSAYCCIESHCSFNLHKSCFDSPREIRHKSHLHHPLTLLTAPPYNEGFTCNACLKDGKAFTYNCVICSYDLHIGCIKWPETVTRPDHKHSLTLYYSSPIAEAATFICDVCKDIVNKAEWVYYCRECDFGTHLACVHSEMKQQNISSGGEDEDVEERLFRLQQQQAILDFQMQMARQNAEFMTSIANSWKNFY